MYLSGADADGRVARAASPPRSGTNPLQARIPSLDGLRALSITLVVFAHVCADSRLPDWTRALAWGHDLGRLGVAVFFIISGFLITTLLLDEQQREGRVWVSRFYFRRTLRIFPTFYVFLAFVAALAATGALKLRPGDLLHAGTYTMNLHGARSIYIGHAWSLTIEEQFYLVWPAMLILLGRRYALWLTAGATLGWPVVRIILYGTSTGLDRELAGFSLLGNVDLLAAGAALALLGDRVSSWAWYQQLQRYRLIALLPVLGVLAWNGFGGHWRVARVTQTLTTICLVLCVRYVIDNKDGLAGRVLNARSIVRLGQLSYSLYLWQQLFIRTQFLDDNGWLAAASVTRFPVNLAAMLLCAFASYQLVERPAFSLRRRLEARYFASPLLQRPALPHATGVSPQSL